MLCYLHVTDPPPAEKVHVRNMRALRLRYRRARKSARGKDFRHLRIKRVKSAPFEKVHVRNMRASGPRYRLARKSLLTRGFRTAPLRVITPCYLSGPCLLAGKFRAERFLSPAVFRTERFRPPSFGPKDFAALPPFRDGGGNRRWTPMHADTAAPFSRRGAIGVHRRESAVDAVRRVTPGRRPLLLPSAPGACRSARKTGLCQ